jgi:hypothetical protein
VTDACSPWASFQTKDKFHLVGVLKYFFCKHFSDQSRCFIICFSQGKFLSSGLRFSGNKDIWPRSEESEGLFNTISLVSLSWDQRERHECSYNYSLIQCWPWFLAFDPMLQFS